MESLLHLAIVAAQEKLGVDFTGELSSDGNSIKLIPTDYHENEAFLIQYTVGFRSAYFELIPGKFSAQLIKSMGDSEPECRALFYIFAKVLEERGAKITFWINGQDFSNLDSTDWPIIWQSVKLKIRSRLRTIDPKDLMQMVSLIDELLVPSVGMVTSLIGMEEVTENQIGEPEGNEYETLSKRYERKKINREACIQLKGDTCCVCGFNFSTAYGSIGDGFIEVHHSFPVSQMGPDHKIDIMAELFPLCSNCHSMVHRENPPITIEKLKTIRAEGKMD